MYMVVTPYQIVECDNERTALSLAQECCGAFVWYNGVVWEVLEFSTNWYAV